MSRAIHLVILLLATLVLPVGSVCAEVKPNNLITSGAVLQQGVPLPIWGTASEAEKITVEFQGQEATTTTKDGHWMLRLKPLKPGGPFSITIRGSNVITLTNVLVGEVWLASGQSNMHMALQQCENGPAAATNAADSMLRFFTVPGASTDEPQLEVKGNWVECTPETARSFSGVAYFFGRDLRQARKVPVGLIHASAPGSPAEAWTSRKYLLSDPILKSILDNYEASITNYPAQLEKYKQAEPELRKKYEDAMAKAVGEAKETLRPPTPPVDPARHPHRPSTLYNGMIAALQPFAIRGVLWYQGESNAGHAYQYQTLLPTLIRAWRETWDQGEFPFLLVQLAPFYQLRAQPEDSDWAELREAQRLTSLKVPKTALVVTTDTGEATSLDPNTINMKVSLHPRKKEPVGARLALAARAIAYGEAIEYSGPVYESMKVNGDRVRLTFQHVGGGLVMKDGELKGFTIAGEDRKFVHAQAEIKGGEVIVWSPQVTKPVAVRFGWARYPVVTLFNKQGLPASPFRTDDFPMITAKN